MMWCPSWAVSFSFVSQIVSRVRKSSARFRRISYRIIQPVLNMGLHAARYQLQALISAQRRFHSLLPIHSLRAFVRACIAKSPRRS